MDNDQIFSDEYQGSESTGAIQPKKVTLKSVEDNEIFDNTNYQLSKPRRKIIKAKIIANE